jgi:quercetin dioxygenase-like cupin family protein
MGQSGIGAFSLFIPLLQFSESQNDFAGSVVSEEDGEAFHLRDGKPTVKIKISKRQGSESVSYLASTLPPGDIITIHKHSNEDEFFFIHKGSGIFTLGDKEYKVTEGAIIITPRNIWHGLKNEGSEDIEMRFGYTPAGFEEFFREMGTPVGQPFKSKTPEQRKTIAEKWGMILKD